MRRVWLTAIAALIVGCGGESVRPESGTLEPGLQYEGAILSQPDRNQQVELSAPLFPDSRVFDAFQDQNNPYTSLSAAQRLALLGDVYTFETLLPLCADSYPDISLREPGDPPLTQAEITTNYDQVGRCSYDLFGAKPYWIPQHVSDVDICGVKLGEGWHLPTAAEVAGLPESTFEFFQETLTLQPDADLFPAHFYYSLDVYVRGDDGALALGNLAPQTDHVVPLPVSGDELDQLYVGNGRPIGLRCLRVTSDTH